MRPGEVFRARVAQSKRRPAPAVSQHHVRSGEGVSSTAYRGSRVAILRHGEPPDKSRRHHRGASRGDEARCDRREYHAVRDRVRFGCVPSWKTAPRKRYEILEDFVISREPYLIDDIAKTFYCYMEKNISSLNTQ